MKIINKLILMIILLQSFAMNAQKTDNQEVIDCISIGVVDFFVEINRIEKPLDNKSVINSVGIYEIYHNKKIGYNTNGIYRFTSYDSHRPNYLLLKKGNSYKILTLFNLSNTINDVIRFLNELNYSQDDTMKYLELVLIEIKKHNDTKWDNQINPREQEWIICK